MTRRSKLAGRSTPIPGGETGAGGSSAAIRLLPLAAVGGLYAFTWWPSVGDSAALSEAFFRVTVMLGLWAVLVAGPWRTRPMRITVSVKPQHWVQALTHASIFVYWGMYWESMRDATPLILAQVVFAYAFDMLLTWSRRDTWVAGFGVFPIVFSTNLFLRFRDDWFIFQFAMLALGFLAKELIAWHRDGRRVHIFNPSSFPLAVVSLVLIATGTTDLTWGREIATLLFLPPGIYLFLFLVSLPGQYLFGITTMTLSAVLVTYGFSAAYFAATGTYYFIDSHVPVAVFLGMHLLFTDPSTAPRTEVGRIVFGALYGATVVGLYWALPLFGAPTFYDKLLQVPVMNLMVRWIDGAVRNRAVSGSRVAREGTAAPMRRLAYTSAWVVIFVGMSASNTLGDHHPGHTVPFWVRACDTERNGACKVLEQIHSQYCGDGSGWACNEYGIARSQSPEPDPGLVAAAFDRACVLGVPAGCANRNAPPGTQAWSRAAPSLRDYRVLLRTGKGEISFASPREIYETACRDGWADGCLSLGLILERGDGVAADPDAAAEAFRKACALGDAGACARVPSDGRR